MLHLVMRAGRDYYALSASRVEAVLPCAAWKEVPGAPPAIAGILNYQGKPIVVVDCGMLLAREATPLLASTRIALCRVHGIGAGSRLLGLLGGEMTQIQQIPPEAFRAPGAGSPEMRCVGSVAERESGWVQALDPERILDPEVMESLLVGEETMSI